jgi:2-iminobutanoate/2-iminopropanoate deaminase
MLKDAAGRLAAALVVVATTCGCAAVASRPPEKPTPEFLSSGKVLPANLPFSEAVRVGDTLYLSGQIGIVPGTLTLVSGGTAGETRQVMENIKASLKAHGYSMSDLVKCTVMLADIAEWDEFNEVYRTYFSGRYPARSAFGANALALGAHVEVECIASRPVN